IVAPGYLPERDVCWEVTDCAWVRAGSIAARPGAGARREGRDLRLPHGARPHGVRVRFPPTLLRRADLAVIMDTPPRAMPTGLSRGPATARKSTRRAPSRPFRAVPVTHLATPRRPPSESRPLPKVLAVPNLLAVRRWLRIDGST